MRAGPKARPRGRVRVTDEGKGPEEGKEGKGDCVGETEHLCEGEGVRLRLRVRVKVEDSRNNTTMQKNSTTTQHNHVTIQQHNKQQCNCPTHGAKGGSCVSCSPDGLFAQQEREPIRGRPAVRGKGAYGGRPGQRVEEQGTWASRTQKHSEEGHRRPEDGGVWRANTVKRPRQQPAQPPIRQILGAADAQTAHPATFSTAPAHQRLGSANAETTPAGAPAAAADRTQRPDATCEGKNG